MGHYSLKSFNCLSWRTGVFHGERIVAHSLDYDSCAGVFEATKDILFVPFLFQHFILPFLEIFASKCPDPTSERQFSTYRVAFFLE